MSNLNLSLDIENGDHTDIKNLIDYLVNLLSLGFNTLEVNTINWNSDNGVDFDPVEVIFKPTNK